MKTLILATLIFTAQAHAFETTGNGDAVATTENRARDQAIAKARAEAHRAGQASCASAGSNYAVAASDFSETVTSKPDGGFLFRAEARVSADFECLDNPPRATVTGQSCKTWSHSARVRAEAQSDALAKARALLGPNVRQSAPWTEKRWIAENGDVCASETTTFVHANPNAS